MTLSRSLEQLLATPIADIPQREAAALLASLGVRILGRGLTSTNTKGTP